MKFSLFLGEQPFKQTETCMIFTLARWAVHYGWANTTTLQQPAGLCPFVPSHLPLQKAIPRAWMPVLTLSCSWLLIRSYNWHTHTPAPPNGTCFFSDVPKEQRLQAVQAAIMLMSDENREVLQTLLCFLSDVTSVEENQMTPMNVAVCLAPSLFHLNIVKKESSPRQVSSQPYK